LTKYIEASEFRDSAELGTWLGENFGITFVPGIYFSQAGANWARFSYALPPEKTQQAINRLFEGLNHIH
jgi:aspartate/methionine/tyrosine aminotransferase